MKKTKSTKRALLSAVLALVMTVSMLVGTTFAWFTDSVTSSGNKIAAGNLNVELYLFNGTSYVDISDATLPIFGEKDGEKGLAAAADGSDILWEPGKTQVAYLAIKNAGSLALKYRVSLDVTAITKSLNDVLSYTITPDAKAPEGKLSAWDGTDAKRVVAGEQIVSASDVAMQSGDMHYFALSVHMDEEAGNEYMDGSITFDLTVLATQLASEEDSFGKDYDKGAGYLPNSTNPEALPDAGNTAEDIVLESKDGVSVSVPSNIDFPEDTTALSLNFSDKIVDTANNTITFEKFDVLDQDGNVIDLSENTTPISVTINVGKTFAEGTRLDIFHDDKLVGSGLVDAEGNVTYQAVHFCKVQLKASVADFSVDNLVIDSVADLILFADMVNGGNKFQGKTVTLAADLDLGYMSWTPIGNATYSFDGTFDGNGKTISNLLVDKGTASNAGLFGVTQNGEIKNLTVENAIVSGRLNVGVVAGTPYTSKYTNITVCGHVEVNGMAYVGAVGGKNAYANWTNITVDVDEKSYVKAYSIENGIAYRTYVGGVIGFMGEGSHTVANVKSNIDVYGSTQDVGGIVGIAHYNNTFDNVVCTGDVYVTDATDATEAEEIGGIAGVWHNGADVTIKDSKFTGKLYSNVEGVDLSDNIYTGNAYNKEGPGKLIINTVWVSTAEELVANLEAGNSVIFLNDIKINPAELSNAYGKTGINVLKGQMIDGNGYTLNINGAGGTWDSGINTTGGIIRDIKITGAFRGVFINHTSEYSETVVLDNVVIDGTVYTISCDQGKSQNFIAINSTFNGWTSYAATVGNGTFINCKFGEGSGYAFLRPYASTTFVNCEFEAGYEMDPRASVSFENCKLDGVLITEENLSDLVISNIDKVTSVK